MNDTVPSGETLDAHRAAVIRAGIRAFFEASRGGVPQEDLLQYIEYAAKHRWHQEHAPVKKLWQRILGM